MKPPPVHRTLIWIAPVLLPAAALSGTFYEMADDPDSLAHLRFGLLALAAVWSLLVDLTRRFAIPTLIVNAGLITAAGLAVWEWRSDVVPLLVLHHFIMAVATAKLVQAKKLTDYEQVLLLALLLITLGGVISPSLWFVVAVGLFVVLGVHAMIVLHLERERYWVRRAQAACGIVEEDDGRRIDHPSFRRASVFSAVVMVAVSSVVFLMFPRVRLDAFAGIATGVVRTGYDPEIRFDGSSIVSESEREVCKVTLLRDGQPYGSPGIQPYFRLSTRHKFAYSQRSGLWYWSDGNAKTGDERRHSVPGPPATATLVPADPALPTIEQRYTADSLPTGYKIFHLYPPVTLSAGHFMNQMMLAPDLSMRATRPRRPVAYAVTSVDVDRLTGDARRFMLELRDWVGRPDARQERDWSPPPVSERVRRKAQELADEVGGAGDPANHRRVAERIRSFLLSSEFTYVIDKVSSEKGAEPVDDLLFVTKRGNCEYFATAMAVMLQVAGVPARIVSGYHGGEFSEVGAFYVVREKFAHAWVEVFLPDRGWTTFDPTPASEVDERDNSTWAKLRASLDYVQYLWVTNVVAFDTDYQASLWEKVKAWVRAGGDADGKGWQARLRQVRAYAYGPPDLTPAQRAMWWVALLLIGLWLYYMTRLVRVLARRAMRGVIKRRQAQPHGFYGRVLAALARRGFHKEDGQTPREFARSVTGRVPALAALIDITRTYYRTRFGGQRLTADESGTVDRFLNSLD